MDSLFEKHGFPPPFSPLTIGTGWYHILDQLFPRLVLFGVRRVEVKTKYGALRVYTDVNAPAIQAAIAAAEVASLHTCEICGRVAVLRALPGILQTLCEPCYSKALKADL